MKHSSWNYQKGLSIAELAIVIVIIGILTGMVAGGLRMQKASQLRGIILQVSGFQIAIESFDDQYRDLPGDMSDAHDYWDDGANGVCGTAAECNGDSDGLIELDVSSGSESESFRAWQHLDLSGFLGGGYSGTATISVDQSDLGINIPIAKINKAGYYLIYGDLSGGSRNEIRLGNFRANEVNSNASLTALEAFAIDNKSDDGDADDGRIFAADGSDATANDCVDGSGEYDKSKTTTACVMSFPIIP